MTRTIQRYETRCNFQYIYIYIYIYICVCVCVCVYFTHTHTQCVPLATEYGISLIILTPMKILQ